MMVLVFLYYFITLISYFICSTVQYSTNSTDNTTLVTEKPVNATLVNATFENPTRLNAILVNATLVNETIVNATIVNATHVNETLVNAAFVNPAFENATIFNAILVNGALVNETIVNAIVVNATLVNETTVNATHVSETLVNATFINATFEKATLFNAILANGTLVNEIIVNAVVVNPTLVNETTVNSARVDETLVKATLLNGTLVNATLINATEVRPKATMRRRCVIHESDLKDLLQSECFVDKSLIIKDFLRMKSHIARITAPRRFGKTLNLKMLKAFLQADNGLITSYQTEGCSLFVKYNLNIFTWNNTFFHLHCGKYPVIYINFKKITGTDLNGIFGAFGEVIHDLYLEHVYLRYSTRINDNEKKCILKYIGLYSNKTFQDLTQRILIDGFVYLSEVLYYHFNTKAVVLIDDFDASVWLLLSRDSQSNYFPVPDVLRTIFLIKNFLSQFLVSNRYIERGLINNCLQMTNVFLSELPSIVHFPFLANHPLVKYYGLTEDEVREKLNYFNIGERHEDVKNYYNGYKVRGSGDSIYNTWSVMNYLQTEKLDDYWITTAGLHNFSKMFLKREIRRLLFQLLNWKYITIEICKLVRLDDILNLQHAMTTNRECNWFEAEAFLRLLSNYGYFSPMRINISQISLKIPNYETYHYLYKQYVANCNL